MADDKMKYIPDHVEESIVRQEKETGREVQSYLADTGQHTHIPGEYGGKPIIGLHARRINRPIEIDWISIFRSLLVALIAEELNPRSIMEPGALEREIFEWCKNNDMSISRGAAEREAKRIREEVRALI